MTSTPPAEPAAPAAKSPVFSIVSLVLGILGLLGSFCFGSGSLFALVGLILGIVGRKRELNGKGLALGGIITGAAGLVVSVVTWIILAVAAVASSQLPTSY